MNANFFDIHSAADFIGPGAIEVPYYQTEITDIVRRRGLFGQRIKQVPATGHPSRFFEETAIPNPGTAGFVNPRAIVAPTVSPTRVERSVPLKAIVAQINYNLFDIELGNQQKQFAYLQAKDLVDTVEGVLNTHDVALWNGDDTSLATPTTAQYFGAIGQIVAGGNTTTIGTTASIVDGLKSTVAQMVSNSGFRVRPTAIYANPVLLDLIDREMKSEFNVVLTSKEITAGLYRQDPLDPGGRSAPNSGVGAGIHGHAGFGFGSSARIHRHGRHDRVPLAERSRSADLPAGRTWFAGLAVCRGEIWRRGGEGRELRALPGPGRPVGAGFGAGAE